MIRIYGRKVRAKGDDLHATTSLLCVAQHVKDMCAWYTWLEAYGSLFSYATNRASFRLPSKELRLI